MEFLENDTAIVKFSTEAALKNFSHGGVPSWLESFLS